MLHDPIFLKVITFFIAAIVILLAVLAMIKYNNRDS